MKEATIHASRVLRTRPHGLPVFSSDSWDPSARLRHSLVDVWRALFLAEVWLYEHPQALLQPYSYGWWVAVGIFLFFSLPHLSFSEGLQGYIPN